VQPPELQLLVCQGQHGHVPGSPPRRGARSNSACVNNQTQRWTKPTRRSRGVAAVSAGLEAILPTGQHAQRLRRLRQWIRHRLRALQLKQWNRGPKVYAELRNLGVTRTPRRKSRRTPACGGVTRPCSCMSVSIPATTTESEYPDWRVNLNLPKRRMRTRMSGGVAGECGAPLPPMPISSGP
jgi:hypothetical protein